MIIFIKHDEGIFVINQVPESKFFDNLIWGIDDVCAFTKYAKGTIYNLVNKGEIPYRRRKKKGRLVFVPSEVIAWFKGERT